LKNAINSGIFITCYIGSSLSGMYEMSVKQQLNLPTSKGFAISRTVVGGDLDTKHNHIRVGEGKLTPYSWI
jgi:hypothetical protein